MKKFFHHSPYLLKFIVAIILILSNTALFSQTAPVTTPKGGFKIDGQLRANTPGAPAVQAGDWVPRLNSQNFTVSVDSFAIEADGDVEDNVTTRLQRDVYNSNLDDIFTQGSKFNDYITALRHGLGGAPNKNDIHNGMFHASADNANPANQWVFIGGDRLDVAGTSYIDFEFLQGTITTNASTFAGSGLAGGRTLNDINISMEYNNGGSAPKVVIYKWAPTNEAGTAWAWDSTGSSLITQAYAKTNLVTVDVPFGAFGGITYQPFAFVESAINVSQLVSLVTGNCAGLTIKTLWIKTKASSSSTAALKDFMSPISLNLSFGGVSIDTQGPFCANASTITLTGSPSGGTFTGPGTSGANGATFNPATAGVGTHTIVYSASAGANCTKTASTEIVVRALPTASISGSTTLCKDAASPFIVIQGAGGTKPYTFSYNIGGGSTLQRTTTGTNDTVRINVPTGTATTYVYNLLSVQESSSTTCSQNQTGSATVIVNPLPTANAGTAPVGQCAGISGNDFNLSGSFSNGTALWTVQSSTGTASGSVQSGSTTATPQVHVDGVGTVTFLLTVTSNQTPSCGSPTSTVTVTVNPNPTANAGSAPTAQCAGESGNDFNLSGSFSNGTALWTVQSSTGTASGSVTSGSTGATPQVHVTGAGTVTYLLTVTSNQTPSCGSATNTVTVTVNANPSDLTANVTQPTCSVPTGTITVTSGTTGLTFSLNSTNPADFTNNTGIFGGLSAGSYTIRSKNAAGCISNGLGKTINAAAGAPAAGDVSIITNPSCTSSTGTLKVVVAATGLEYSSDFEISVTGSNVWHEHDYVFTFTAGEGYNFTVRRKSDHTCTTTVVCLGEEAAGGANLSNNTTVSSGRIANSSAIESAAQTTVKAFPNPFNDRVKFVVPAPQAGYGSLDVMNMLGQKVKTVFQGQMNAGSQSFEMSLPEGRYSTLFYILRINGKQVSGKLVQAGNTN